MNKDIFTKILPEALPYLVAANKGMRTLCETLHHRLENTKNQFPNPWGPPRALSHIMKNFRPGGDQEEHFPTPWKPTITFFIHPGTFLTPWKASKAVAYLMETTKNILLPRGACSDHVKTDKNIFRPTKKIFRPRGNKQNHFSHTVEHFRTTCEQTSTCFVQSGKFPSS